MSVLYFFSVFSLMMFCPALCHDNLQVSNLWPPPVKATEPCCIERYFHSIGTRKRGVCPVPFPSLKLRPGEETVSCQRTHAGAYCM
ncbi:hypothetical protein LDENG_00299460 [Lucifuga dentata]|nr:hypothetical protein LDENG_00299460 [Lucifuga dentata]